MKRWISDGMGGFHLPNGGRLISDGMGGFIEAAGSGGVDGLAAAGAMLLMPIFLAIIGGAFFIVFASPFYAIYYGFISTKYQTGTKVLIWIYLGIYLVGLWFLGTAALVPHHQ